MLTIIQQLEELRGQYNIFHKISNTVLILIFYGVKILFSVTHQVKLICQHQAITQ